MLLIGFWIFFMRQMQSGGNKALSFGKSRARLLSSQQKKVTFKDVAGVEEAKEELQEIIEFLQGPEEVPEARRPHPQGRAADGPAGHRQDAAGPGHRRRGRRALLLHLAARTSSRCSSGVGASRVRDLFEQGKKNAPCIIFIDEIDAVGRHRGAGLGGGHDEREQTLNQLLVEMDGFESNDGVILIAATNRPDVLDPALLRPGPLRPAGGGPAARRPRAARGSCKVHTRKIPLGDDVDLAVLARGTPGFSGADLANLVNEAALLRGAPQPEGRRSWPTSRTPRTRC